jgi:hypothetical protein
MVKHHRLSKKYSSFSQFSRSSSAVLEAGSLRVAGIHVKRKRIELKLKHFKKREARIQKRGDLWEK